MSSSSTFQPPPLDGSITFLPGVVDFNAEHNPTHAWSVFLSQEEPKRKIYISYPELARASHKVAHHFRPAREGAEQEVVAILVNCDVLLYMTLLVGLKRAGIVPFPMSSRNSPDAICYMLKTTRCHKVIHQPSVSGLTSQVQETLRKEDYDVTLVDLPPLQEIYPTFTSNGENEATYEEYPPPKVPRGPQDLAIYIHSSGSTGLPKSIAWTEKIFLLWADSYIVRLSFEHQLRWACMALPIFHSAGIIGHVLAPLMSGQPCSLFTPQSPAPPIQPNPQNLIDVAIGTDCNAIAAVPIFVEIWCRAPEKLQYLAALKCLAFGGAGLSQNNGDALAAAGTNLASVYGITEIGVVNQVTGLDFSPIAQRVSRSPEAWNWIQFDDRLQTRFIDQGDGTYELQVLSSESYPLAVENLPDVPGYATKDVFKPHPTKPGLWSIVGRADDVIILRSGLKVVPLPQEDSLNSVPIISGAIMFGRGQNQPGVIIELAHEHTIDVKNEEAVIKLRNMLWPQVEAANNRAPAWARLFKETILIADPAKPFARAAKGSAIRSMVLKSYESEINEIYNRIGEASDDQGIAPPEAWTIDEVRAWLSKHAASISKDRIPDPSVDLFEQGFDSLSATFLRNRIIGALRRAEDKSVQYAMSKISQDFVFRHATILRLSSAVVSAIDTKSSSVDTVQLADEIRTMIEKYSTDFPAFGSYQPHGSKVVVLLTGSTGALGSHILSTLLSSSLITKVYTLNRGENVSDRQRAAFLDKGLPVVLLSSEKLVSLTGDIRQADFGLTDSQLRDIRGDLTHLIHNAWKVDFNLSLASLETHLASTRNLINFSATCSNTVRFTFTSSISSAYVWNSENGPIPEQVIDNPNVATVSGYGASKYVAEHVIARAARQGLSATSARLGQICGSTTHGDWNTSEWFPILVKTSMALGRVPEIHGDVSWIPINTTGQTIFELMHSTSPLPEVVNVAHPHPVDLYNVLSNLNEVLGNRLKVVSLQDWVNELEALSAASLARVLEEYPAIKLLNYWKGFLQTSAKTEKSGAEAGGGPVLEIQHAVVLSETLRTASPVGRADVERWVQYWRKIGYIPS